MTAHQHTHDLPLLSLMASELGSGSSLQIMPSLSKNRTTFTSTSEARWYAIDPDIKETHEVFLRKQRAIFDEFAESCLKGFRRIFPRVVRASMIATAGQVVGTDENIQFAGDIIMIGYQDGSRQYVPYRRSFGINHRQQTWKMVSIDVNEGGSKGYDVVMSLIATAKQKADGRGEPWRLSFFDPTGSCWTGTICPLAFDEDLDCTLYALPTKNIGEAGMLDPFAHVY
ncbi:hypothetical protein HFO69_35235 [Rhizobium laguerreae]|uniref:hypothetical protein n=1 Tax=Rhizobium laguerreae TaxID=1076926 RepID=UPI001C924BE3|nr:hypothetical protein [Rhizobium laguerreae]MBY3102863.1 hypothetical protein [Rhizobium laguerreae]